ncbi:efflux transporter outer membrane subunit [Pseudogulbenkiania sp. MAI-1]|uniref:efflux transporter outer membrane subunit n=1 Tax=Pseudogulbenkiania sp. MAI-1 TaxID=990370 RepID=UPI00045E7D0D|nr:efflux transporter outer membrane subunit [Pseudogulbenkiania sp. MAI-1]
MILKLSPFIQAALGTACLLTLAGCASVGPDYERPALKMPANWQAAVPHDGSTRSLLSWWQSFNDPTLDDLLKSAENDNPTLAKAAAAIASARASYREASASAYPSSTIEAAHTRSGPFNSSARGIATVNSGELDASWEIDLFGAVRRSRESASDRVEAVEADWHSARVSLAAEVASEYVNYRACRLLSENQQQNLDSLRKTESTTSSAVNAQLMAPAESILAQASVAGAAASLNVQEAECDLSIKALVALTGLEEPALRATLIDTAQKIPSPTVLNVTTLPVQLLSQRPDLVSAERNLAAANADIGVAEANRYPRLSLLGSVSVNRTQTVGAPAVQTNLWSFGPSLSIPLFNGGALRAQADKARADYVSALATYQSAVRNAVKETEQSLVRLDAANRRSQDLANSARDYRRYFETARQNWQTGGISLLTLEEARRNALQAEQNAIAVQRDRVLYGIALYKALGGGWQATQDTKSTGAGQ